MKLIAEQQWAYQYIRVRLIKQSQGQCNIIRVCMSVRSAGPLLDLFSISFRGIVWSTRSLNNMQSHRENVISDDSIWPAAARRRPRSDLYSGLRGHVMLWNRKHLYRPSGTEICSPSDSSCQRWSQILDFFQKGQTLRAFHFLRLFFFFVFSPGQARRCQILSAAVRPQPLV